MPCTTRNGSRSPWRGPEGDRHSWPHPDPRLPARTGRRAGRVLPGGSLMVGAVGRTDLCGPDLAEPLAHDMFHSLRRLDGLPDDLAVYPTHGAGSFCSAPGGSERTGLGRARPTTCSASTTRTASSSSCWRVRIRSPPTSLYCLSSTAGTPPLRAASSARPARRRHRLAPRRRRRPDRGRATRWPSSPRVTCGSMSSALRPVFASWLGWLTSSIADRHRRRRRPGP